MFTNRRVAFILLILFALVAPILQPINSQLLPMSEKAGRQNAATALAATSPAATQYVTVDLIALDRKDRPVTDLKLEDLKLLEDNIEQKITSFSPASDEPLTIGLFFDTSNSRRLDRFVNEEAKVAGEFVHSVWRQGDAGFVFAFDNEVTVVAQPTLHLEDIDQALEKIAQARPGGAAAIYDALGVIEPEKLAALPGRKIYIVISNFDHDFSERKAGQVVEVARKAGVSIFPVAVEGIFGGVSSGNQKKETRQEAQTIAEKTGGEVLIAESKRQLKEAFLRLTNDLRGSYRITYVPSDGKKKKKIQIESSKAQTHLPEVLRFIN